MLPEERNPYPHHYSTAFAFSPLLYPHPRRCRLRETYRPVNLPLPEGYGLTLFRSEDVAHVTPVSAVRMV